MPDVDSCFRRVCGEGREVRPNSRNRRLVNADFQNLDMIDGRSWMDSFSVVNNELFVKDAQ